MQGRSLPPGARRQGGQSSQLQEVGVHGEAWKLTLTRNGVVFKLEGFESSIQLLLCVTLLGFIAF